MANIEGLTPEQNETIGSLTQEELKQLSTLVGPDGKVDDNQLSSVAGGLTSKMKKILGWSAATLAVVATLVGIGYTTKGKYWSKKKLGGGLTNTEEKTIITEKTVGDKNPAEEK